MPKKALNKSQKQLLATLPRAFTVTVSGTWNDRFVSLDATDGTTARVLSEAQYELVQQLAKAGHIVQRDVESKYIGYAITVRTYAVV